MQSIEATGTEMPKDIIREKLLIAVKEYKITLDTLNRVTGIDINWLSDYINGIKERDDLPIEKRELLWEIIIFLSEGITVRGDIFANQDPPPF